MAGRSRGKRPSKHLREARPLSSGHASAAHKGDGRWIVRSISGQATMKSYTCPGCLHPIPPGTAHVVVWSAEDSFGATGVDGRRHWHTGCWQRRP